MKALQLLQVLWLLLLFQVAYATASSSVVVADSQRQVQAEVNGAAGQPQRRLRFGAKTATQPTQQTIMLAAAAAINSSTAQRNVATAPAQRMRTAGSQNRSGAMRISRRYDDSPAVAQRITQYEIPVVSKSRDAAKGQQRSRYRGGNALPSTAEEAPNNFQTSQNLFPRPHNSSRGVSAAAVTANSNANRSNSSRTRASAAAAARLRKTTTTTTTTTTTSTSTPRPTLLSNFGLNNPFSMFPANFWSFSNPASQPTTPTKKPPKKYIPSPSPAALPAAISKEEKLSYHKPKLLTKPTKPTEPPMAPPKKENTDGPFRIALPTLNFFNPQGQKQEDTEKEKEKRAAAARELRERFTCPQESEVRFQLFPKICKTDKDCSVWNREELCCEIFGAKSCVSGMPKPLEESQHAPILGLIPRKCPTRPLAELWWEVKECQSDMDCWPRVCCPDGRRRYCRTSQPELETAPVQVKRSFNYLTEYLECTAPPPPIFDLHPKACTSTLDCFPNVCCQEAGLRHCRPPKKSVLTLMANFLNVDFVKRLTQNIVIK